MKINDSDLVVLIDVQRDFMTGGSLAVPDAERILPTIERMAQAPNLVLTQDWHPADHVSFADNHPSGEPFSQIEVGYGAQTLWPRHCVQNTPGAAFGLPDNITAHAQAVFRKGFRRDIDSYSAFIENDQSTHTGLAGFFRERQFDRAVFAGLALDYCVAASALDAVKLGLRAAIVLDGCAGIAENSVEEALANLTAAGVELIGS